MELNEIVGMNLKYYRYKKGKSQEKFYSELGLNYKYYADIENGKINFKMDTIQKIANKLHLNINNLVIYNEKHIITKKRIDEKEKINL